MVTRSTTAPAGHDVHARAVCIPGADCEFPEIKPDTQSGIHILGNLLSDGTLHLSPIDRKVEATVDALGSC